MLTITQEDIDKYIATSQDVLLSTLNEKQAPDYYQKDTPPEAFKNAFIESKYAFEYPMLKSEYFVANYKGYWLTNYRLIINTTDGIINIPLGTLKKYSTDGIIYEINGKKFKHNFKEYMKASLVNQYIAKAEFNNLDEVQNTILRLSNHELKKHYPDLVIPKINPTEINLNPKRSPVNRIAPLPMIPINQQDDNKSSNKENNSYSSFEPQDMVGVYSEGANLMIACAALFSVPFAEFGKELVAKIQEFKTATPQRIEELLKLNSEYLAKFLSSFHQYANHFAEIVTNKTADLVRRKTIRDDVRANSTDSISQMLRAESFRNYDATLMQLTENLQSLGIQLDSVSTFNSSVQGGLVGGGLGYLMTDGKSTKGAAVAGALIGAVAAEAEKAKLRQQLIEASFVGIKEIIDKIEFSFLKLIDQYLAYILGGKVDFDARDSEVKKIKNEVIEITSSCNYVLSSLRKSSEMFGGIRASLERVKKPIRTRVWVITGIVILIIGSQIVSDFKYTEGYDFAMAILWASVFAPYIFYRVFIKKKMTAKSLEKIPSEINLLEQKTLELKNIVNNMVLKIQNVSQL